MFQRKRYLVVGLGVSGTAAARLLQRHGAIVDTFDDKGVGTVTDIPDWTVYDCVVLSPGVPPSHRLVRQAIQNRRMITGEAELATALAGNRRMLGITGTNGKTTVTLLVEHLLKSAGVDAVALGNVGVPFSEIEATPDNATIVGEYSSYQLETLSSRRLSVAAILNITADHLDRYATFGDYAGAKLRMGACLTGDGTLILHESVACGYDFAIPYWTYGFSERCTVTTDGARLLLRNYPVALMPAALCGKRNHDVENFLVAAAMVIVLGIAPEGLARSYETFVKPHHRVEFVAERNGVKYYDDSKGTNVAAVVTAVESMEGHVWLIAGGVHKGGAYTPWRQFVGRVNAIFAIGQAAEIIAKDLDAAVRVVVCGSLEEAVARAKEAAQPGDSVLLSPGCSSFDMFRDYKDRGERFQRLV